MALNPRKLIIVGTGAVCSALVVIMLLNVALRPKEEAPKVAKGDVEVMIATRALKTGDVLDDKKVKWQEWDSKRLYEGLVTRKVGEKTEAVGKMRRDVAIGEPITKSAMVGDKDGTMLASQLDPGMRAVGVKVTAEASAGGFVLPGDHVDVVLSHQIKVDSRDANMAAGLVDSNASETILENVRVLAVDQNADKNENAKVGRTATLEVTPKQAEILLLGARMGDLSLTLRGLSDPKEEAEADSKAEPAHVASTTTKPKMAKAPTTDLEVSRILGRLHAQNEAGGPVQNVRIYNSVAVDSRIYAIQTNGQSGRQPSSTAQ